MWLSKRSIHHPQQSVLNRHAGQRQTACIRYISAPQRSQKVFSSIGAGGVRAMADVTGVMTGFRGSGIREFYRVRKCQFSVSSFQVKTGPHCHFQLDALVLNWQLTTGD
jgi:hypothetical protein